MQHEIITAKEFINAPSVGYVPPSLEEIKEEREKIKEEFDSFTEAVDWNRYLKSRR